MLTSRGRAPTARGGRVGREERSDEVLERLTLCGHTPYVVTHIAGVGRRPEPPRFRLLDEGRVICRGVETRAHPRFVMLIMEARLPQCVTQPLARFHEPT